MLEPSARVWWSIFRVVNTLMSTFRVLAVSNAVIEVEVRLAMTFVASGDVPASHAGSRCAGGRD